MLEALIPEPIARRLLAFLTTGATGQITLHVLRGQIQGVDCNEMLRLRDENLLRKKNDPRKVALT